MGERSTGGYEIKATDINIKGHNIHIFVEETDPEGGGVTLAHTYPCEVIKLNKEPKNIKVENKDTGYKFNKIFID